MKGKRRTFGSKERGKNVHKLGKRRKKECGKERKKFEQSESVKM